MRITTQMLAHSAAKSGIPFQQTTLLDILNKKSSFSGLLNGVNASADATAIAKKKNYSKLEDISGNLNGYASSLVATDKNSIYDRAKESGSTKDIVSSAKKMVESYNATLKQLRETGFCRRSHSVDGYSCRGQRGIEEHWYHTGKRRQSFH